MLSTEIRKNLQSIVGESSYFDSPNELQAYSFDATPLLQQRPDAVLMPQTVDQIAAVLKVADAQKIPVIPRGAGTNLSGGTIPSEGGLVLGLVNLNQILEIDEKNLTATVQPGVVTADLHKAVEAIGLFFPPDPGSMTASTIGGNLAECAGGMRGLKYGVTKDYVLGIEYVLPGGEIIRCGGKNVKDVAGYDMTRLMIGSEGTLGVITEITLKLLPLPETKRTIAVYCHEMVDAARIVEHIIAARLIPATIEFLDQSTIRVVDEFAGLGLPHNMGAMLIVEQDGNAAQVSQDIQKIIDIAKAQGAAQVKEAASTDEADKLLAARRSALSALSRLRPTTILEDATVPRSKLAEMVQHIQQTAEKYKVQICTFGHAGDGNLHPTCMTDERNEEELRRVDQAFTEIYAKALELGGTITGEHGVGVTKQKYLELKTGQHGMELMRRIKAAFDPNGIMNPGKVFANASPNRIVVNQR